MPGLLVFLIIINDLPSCVNSTCCLFAIDYLIYHQIKSLKDYEVLQHDLLRLEHWGNKWLMQFNPTKCVALIKSHPQYTLNTHYMDRYLLTWKKQNI